MAGSLLLAQTENPLVALTSFGALGIIAGLFIIGKIIPNSIADKADARADRAEAKADTMLDDYKAIVPVLQQAIAAIQTADQARTAQAQQDAEIRVLLSQVRTALEQRDR
jgi:hypothetical protein